MTSAEVYTYEEGKEKICISLVSHQHKICRYAHKTGQYGLLLGFLSWGNKVTSSPFILTLALSSAQQWPAASSVPGAELSTEMWRWLGTAQPLLQWRGDTGPNQDHKAPKKEYIAWKERKSLLEEMTFENDLWGKGERGSIILYF